jgi:hypothetical protein
LHVRAQRRDEIARTVAQMRGAVKGGEEGGEGCKCDGGGGIGIGIRGGGGMLSSGVEIAVHDIKELGCYDVALYGSSSITITIMIAVAVRRRRRRRAGARRVVLPVTEVLRAVAVVVGASAPRGDALECRVHGDCALDMWGEEGVLECECGVEEGLLLLGGQACRRRRRRRRQHAV